MPEPVYIQWNIVNWITIVLMVALGTVVFGTIMKVISEKHSGGNNG